MRNDIDWELIAWFGACTIIFLALIICATISDATSCTTIEVRS